MSHTYRVVIYLQAYLFNIPFLQPSVRDGAGPRIASVSAALTANARARADAYAKAAARAKVDALASAEALADADAFAEAFADAEVNAIADAVRGRPS